MATPVISYIVKVLARVIEAEIMYPIEEAEMDETCIDTEENHIEQVQSLEICIDTEELATEPEGRGNLWGVHDKKNEG